MQKVEDWPSGCGSVERELEKLANRAERNVLRFKTGNQRIINV